MFKNLLVPLDGTPAAAEVLPLAVTLAQTTGADLTLVRVLPENAQTEPESRAYLEQVAADVRAPGRTVTTLVQRGDPAERIITTIREQKADLVVMATHGRGALDRVLHGSVAAKVLGQSPVPVALLRHGAHDTRPLRTILVPMSASPGGAGALAVARDLARTAGATLVLAEVVTPLPRYGRGLYIEPHWEEEMRQRAHEFLDRLAAKLRTDGVAATGRAEIGRITPTLLAIADEVAADLIVMGTHAATGPARAVLGSVADEVLRKTDHPVLLVRLPAEGDDFSDEAIEAAVSSALREAP